MSEEASLTEPSAMPPGEEEAQTPMGRGLAAAGAAFAELAELSAPPQPLLEGGSDADEPDSFYDSHEYDHLDISDLHLEDISDLRGAVRAEVEAALKKFLSPQRVLMRDKLTMVAFTLSLVLGAYALGYSPEHFYRLYTAQGILLMLLRWINYRWTHQHYYLIDWCYFANAMLMLHIWYLPDSVVLAKVMFAHAMGPLLWSVLAFRNSVVFHSLDKMTSHFMHMYPAAVCWAARWHTSGPLAERLRTDRAAAARWEAGGVRDLVLLPMVPYIAWSILYSLKVFVISAGKIRRRGLETLFSYSTRSRRSVFGAVVLRFPPALQPLVYMLMHQLLTFITLLLGQLWWANFWACTCFLTGIFAASAWSGANWYFHIFAGRAPRRPRASATPSQQPDAASPVLSSARKRA